MLATITKMIRSFGMFWWDFIVGEDVTIAIAVVLGLAGVAALHAAKVTAWWALPVIWVLGLGLSLARATKKH
ncbi:MAG: hypothetical protein M0004_01755 [Actinomycetota bacterium]|nr:hypothetical protein [Actinomycetota bacterium]